MVEFTTFDSTGNDVMRTSLARLARNIAASEDIALSEADCGFLIASAVPVLLVDEGAADAVTRATSKVAGLFNAALSWGDLFRSRLFSGLPIDLVKLARDARVADRRFSGLGQPDAGSDDPLLQSLKAEDAQREAVWAYDHCRIVWHLRGAVPNRDPDEGPALLVTTPDGRLVREIYMSDGLLHRPVEDGPALSVWDRAGAVIDTAYAEQGMLTRNPSEGPTRTVCGTEGILCLQYFVEGRLHRDEADGPAVLYVHPETGALLVENYFRGGELHRLAGPASVVRAKNGAVLREEWYRRGRCHRDPADGPAMIHYDDNGCVRLKAFFRNGVYVGDGEGLT